MQQKLAEN